MNNKIIFALLMIAPLSSYGFFKNPRHRFVGLVDQDLYLQNLNQLAPVVPQPVVPQLGQVVQPDQVVVQQPGQVFDQPVPNAGLERSAFKSTSDDENFDHNQAPVVQQLGQVVQQKRLARELKKLSIDLRPAPVEHAEGMMTRSKSKKDGQLLGQDGPQVRRSSRIAAQQNQEDGR